MTQAFFYGPRQGHEVVMANKTSLQINCSRRVLDMYNARLYQSNVLIQVLGVFLFSNPPFRPCQRNEPKDLRATWWCHHLWLDRLRWDWIRPRLGLRDDRAVYLLHTESADGCLFACDASLPCLFEQSSLVMCRPLLLVAFEVRHHESGKLNDERDDHEYKTEDQREA